MSDPHAASPAGNDPQIPVSPDNPCPFLRGLVAGGYVGGHIVPLPKLTATIESATGTKGLKEKLVGWETYGVALIANGLSPLRLLKSWWSGAVLDKLRNGPLDKRGAGSRILEVNGEVDESEIARLAEFGSDYTKPDGGTERGLNSKQITTYMNANFERAKGHRRAIDRLLMNGEWPVLLNIMGKGDGDNRYLSVAEVRTLFVERKFPARIVTRLAQPLPLPSGLAKFRESASGLAFVLSLLLGLLVTFPYQLRWSLAKLLGLAVWLAVLLLLVAVQFPDQLRWTLARIPGKYPAILVNLLPPPLPDMPAVKTARWLDQGWSTEDRHWFHHASQGTKTFPVPYAWFLALEQPRIHLFSKPGLLSDTSYLERFGFISSPKTIHTDKAALLDHGYADSADAPASTPSLSSKWPAENTDGLPVGFARLTGATDPASGVAQPDLIGLTCAACHTGSIHYKGTSIRYDGGPAMLNLLKLEEATGLSIGYTLLVPGRFNRFATRVLGPNATADQRAELKKGLSAAGLFVKAQATSLSNLDDRVHQQDTEEGYGRLDALNRIGNQVFATDPTLSGLAGFDDNLHVRDAPVSFPPIWTVSWFLWAQYDGSIQQPLIRNAGEALGVSALLNVSPDYDPETLFRSSVDVGNLDAIEKLLKGPNPFEQTPPGFAGLRSPQWPEQMFPNDAAAWKIDHARADRGRRIYAEICVECHLGPVNDPVFDQDFKDKSFWSSSRWIKAGDEPVLDEVLKGVGGMGTDPGQSHVLMLRTVKVPGFLDLDPARDLQQFWGCTGIPASSTTEIPFALALMDVVDRTIRTWMNDKKLTDQQRQERQALWGPRKNCPNPYNAQETHYRVRPLNGVWATAPYLHNGSVPSLYWMLKPAAERPTQFCMGTRDFDPQQVGFRVEAGEKQTCRHGETRFSAVNKDGSPIPGNSNLGHSLEGVPGPGKPGVIGRLLTEDERYDLIEYLKTL